MLPTETPYQQYFDLNGVPLDAGYIYFGLVNQNPETAPVAIYWDPLGTQPASQPVRTMNGYIDRNGTPGRIYVASNYSITVRDRHRQLVYYTGDSADFSSLLPLAGAGGASQIGGGGQVVPSIAALRLLLKTNPSKQAFVTGYYGQGDGGGGAYWLDITDTTSTDNGGTIIVAADGGRWKLQVLSFITAKQFGAKTDGTDNVTIFANIQSWLSSTTKKPKLVFTEGRYTYSVSPNWAIQDAEIEADGEVYFRYTGTGNSVIIDGSVIAGGLYNMKFGHTNKFIVEGPASSAHGVYCKNVLQGCHFGFRVTGAGSTSAGLRVEFAVAVKFDFMCSPNGNSNVWFSQPAFGIYLTNNGNINDPCSYCTFNTPICESINGTGIYLDQAYGNSFYSGTSEQNTSVGIFLTANAHENKFYSMDMESNTDHDIFILGYRNSFFGVDTLKQVTFSGTAVNNVFVGGTHSKFVHGATCVNNTLSGVAYNRSNDGSTIADSSGGKIRLRDNVNIGAGRIENSPPISGFGIPIGVSPFVYTNNTINCVSVSVTGPTISSLSLVRNGVPTPIFGGPGVLELSPADAIQVNYTGTGQTMTVFNR